VFVPEAVKAIARLSEGLPRVINVICNRSLEAAFRANQRTVDVAMVTAAARALGMQEQLPPSPAPAEVKAMTVIDAPVPAADPIPNRVPERKSEPAATIDVPERPAVREPRRPFERSTRAIPTAFGGIAESDDSGFKQRMWLIGGAAAVVAVAVIWLGVRTLFSPAPDTITPPVPAISTPEPAAPGTPSAAPEQPAPGPATTPAPNAAPATTTPPPPAAPSTPSAPAASASSDPLAGAERFEIVVASFRTEERAAVVASEVMTLGLPMRRRASDGWQQVLAGPFATRADAAVAQQRLEGAGLTGTAIVPATR
jgi:hypothetical protein